MRIKIETIVLFAALGLTILSAVLIATWKGFAIFTGLFMLTATVIFTLKSYRKMRAYRDETYAKRYEDAYIYADENNTNFNPDHYQYNKKTEKQIALNERNLKTFVFVGIVLSIAAVTLAVFGVLFVI